MSYFLAYFEAISTEKSFYEPVKAGNILQATSIAERKHPNGYYIEVSEALT